MYIQMFLTYSGYFLRLISYKPLGMLQFINHVNTIIENTCSVPNLSSVLEFVCDHQQAPAMKSLIANGCGKQHCKPFRRSQ